MAGFIYIMSNPAFKDGRIKIGKSDRDPEEYRRNELDTTGVPEPFSVEYLALVENHHDTERAVHRELSGCRPNNQREFFQIGIPEAIIVIRKLSRIRYEKVIYQSPAEIELLRRKMEQDAEDAREQIAERAREAEKLSAKQEFDDYNKRLASERTAREQQIAAEKRRNDSKRWHESQAQASAVLHEVCDRYANQHLSQNLRRPLLISLTLVMLLGLALTAVVLGLSVYQHSSPPSSVILPICATAVSLVLTWQLVRYAVRDRGYSKASTLLGPDAHISIVSKIHNNEDISVYLRVLESSLYQSRVTVAVSTGATENSVKASRDIKSLPAGRLVQCPRCGKKSLESLKTLTCTRCGTRWKQI